MSECPSRFTLVRWKADDLPAIEQVEVAEHVDTCPSCKGIVAGLDANISEYHQTFQAREDRLMRAIRRQKARGSAGTDVGWSVVFKNRIAPMIGIAAAVATIVILVTKPFDEGARTSEDEIGFKGEAAFEIVAMRGNDRFEVTDGSVLEAGDALRFAVTTSGSAYVSVLSLTADGEPSFFYPEAPPEDDPSPLELSGAGRHELPGSGVLDGSEGTEQVVIIYSSRKYDRREVLDELRASSVPRKPFPELEGMGINTVRIEKRPR